MTLPSFHQRVDSDAETNRLRVELAELRAAVERSIVPFNAPDPALTEDIIEGVTTGHVEHHETIHRLLNNGVLGAVRVRTGNGSPEGVVQESPGGVYLNLSGGTGTTLYVKETGVNTTTGWVAK